MADVGKSADAEERGRAGISAAEGPFAELPVESGMYTYEQENLRLRDLCEGYIILGPLNQYTMVTPIPDFINAGNLERALEEFPAPKDMLPVIKDIEKDTPRAVNHMNRLIADYAGNTKRLLDMF
jgi:hypothetical protein